ncbi:MAG TPA: NUDIX hydrolase N-terminal domain-containing protein [Mycobacteriales bacterium]|jgi:ADP-ribose pyrophosphatase YjhB (NUDIX family)|nr:NUDIX hydrolase N-terminal domain-containing protein [Mycobacteriales bacterium]
MSESVGEQLRAIGMELAALSQTGLAFATDRYDLSRYRRLREISAEVFGLLAEHPAEEISAVLELDSGYATPHLDVRGALFDADRVLLVREASDGCWTLPGGWADPLDRPRAAVEREFAEEAGLKVTAHRVAAVWDGMVSNGHRVGGAPFHIWKLAYLCEPTDPDAQPQAGLDGETTDVGFFDLDELPPLSSRRITESQLRALRDRHRDASLAPASD